MTLYPDTSSDPKKEVILNKAPYTKTFIDSSGPTDPESWIKRLNQHAELINTDMERVLGKDWQTKILTPLFILAEKTQVFNPKYNFDVLSGNLKNLIKIGWEIGNFKDSEIILKDLVIQLQRIGLLNPNVIRDFQSSENAVNIVQDLVESGVFLRTQFDNPSQATQAEPETTPPTGGYDVTKEFGDLFKNSK